MDKIRLTGVWKNKDKNGNIFLSGNLNPITNLMIMPNTFKKEGDTKAPDFFVYLGVKEKAEKTTNIEGLQL